MDIEFFDLGVLLKGQEVEEIPEALKAFNRVCVQHSACEVLGYARSDISEKYMVILDIGDGTFEQDNTAGILRVERVAVVYTPDADFHWEVRPLRMDFPVTLHQNHVPEGEPRSLCLYISDWKSVERTWTPESFLNRILWWFRSSADGTIHADDQPIEQLFFNSPVTVLLPRDHFEKCDDTAYRLVFSLIHAEGTKKYTLRGEYALAEEKGGLQTPLCIPISIMLDPIENGPVEEYPTCLGSLQSLVLQRGADVLEPLKIAIQERVGTEGITSDTCNGIRYILVIIGIPRTRNGVAERTELLSFAINAGLVELGESLNVLFRSLTGDEKWYIDRPISDDNVAECDSWTNLKLEPLRIQYLPSEEEVRSYSGIEKTDKGPEGIIAGVGSLGSAIAYLWAREAWGNWHYVDSDIIQAHNVIRHIASHDAIGYPKAQVVRLLSENLYERMNVSTDNDYVGSITDNNTDLTIMIEQADLLVDATTTLYVPRDLSEVDSAPRVASVFFTPSGSASVLLLEDQQRSIRSAQLEAQYYRAILKSDWGQHHLEGHSGHFWVGAGCREVSVTLSNELVQLHGATLARQLRKSVSSDKAKICIWDYDDESGSVTAYDIPVAPVRSIQVGQWRVLWDLTFEETIRAERAGWLPDETGGTLLGIIDQQTRNVMLVDWIEQPIDSIASPISFIRGVDGQAALIDECDRLTAGIVSNVGEWHSHPPGYSSDPSNDDIKQLASVTEQFALGGITPIMVIVAETEIGICIEKQHEAIKFD